MPNLRSLHVGNTEVLRKVTKHATFYNVVYDVGPPELYLQASDGREIRITKADVQNIYAAQTGNAALRKLKTVDAINTQIVTTLGPEWIDFIFEFDFDPATLNFTKGNTKPKGAT